MHKVLLGYITCYMLSTTAPLIESYIPTETNSLKMDITTALIVV